MAPQTEIISANQARCGKIIVLKDAPHIICFEANGKVVLSLERQSNIEGHAHQFKSVFEMSSCY